MELIKKIANYETLIERELFQSRFYGNFCSFALKPDEVAPPLGMWLEDTIEDDEGERMWNI